MQSRTTTVSEANQMNDIWCAKCKGCKGHYTSQHDDWLELLEVN